MKKHLWDVAAYLVISGFVYWQYHQEFDTANIIMTSLLLIGIIQVTATFLGILWEFLVWFWDATVNYSKNRRDRTDDEI